MGQKQRIRIGSKISDSLIQIKNPGKMPYRILPGFFHGDSAKPEVFRRLVCDSDIVLPETVQE